MTAPGTEWEDLRKQARLLENEIDTKLMSFSKLCSNYVTRDHHLHIDTTLSSTNSTTSSNSERMYETMSIEIEKLVERLSDINKRMSDAVSSLLGPNSAATHTLQRHHEILQDYRREYERTKANIRNFKTREDLLMNNTNGSSEPTTNGSGQSSTGVATGGLSARRQDYYLKELGHLNNSNRLMEANLEMAMKTKTDLMVQRKHMTTITQKVNALANRFPLINNLMQKIKMSTSYDNRLLSCHEQNTFICPSSPLRENDNNEIYIDENNEVLLYPNAPISVLSTYLAIEKFMIDAKLSFYDQKNLFELILTLLPNENNLSLNKYLKWLICRLQQSNETANETSKRKSNDDENRNLKKFRTTHDSTCTTSPQDTYLPPMTNGENSLLNYVQNELKLSDMIRQKPNEKLDSLINIVLQIAASIDKIKQYLVNKDEISDETTKMVSIEPITNTKRKKQNRTLESERSECIDDILKDSSIIITPLETTSMDIKKTMIFNGRNMIKHLRPNMTITSFTRQVCCDLFTKQEILDRLHTEENERTTFLKQCIRAAWNLSDIQFSSVWNRIRTALMQLRRDVLAGKCMSKKPVGGGSTEVPGEEEEQYNSNSSFFIHNCPSEEDSNDDDEHVYNNGDNELGLQAFIKNEKT
ncbi:unnamed protein product [Didymodactylos carnosus]|uniref:Golgi SNAP receptor complex member 1 n=1 Tax=Didymodactylos carnosus TaxID=1234261 RepID=A0A814EJD1_9BILA|nr:unnamed protein product [Didymodactylos carnosus]CAF3745990.1 unnamed protein product [Didymodactylos carnosus]